MEAASLVLDQGYSVPEASRSLDVGETALRRWVQQRQSERTGRCCPNQPASHDFPSPR
ncbi:transposase, partial [Aeromonas sp. HMWF014]|uniref:transposase n=1 Tax=Aeromonas sp. HMWF014 TaxID=2056850 RepID=UPI002159F9D4